MSKNQIAIAVRRHDGRWSPAQLMGATNCITGRANACSRPALTVLPDGTALSVWADPEHRLVARTLTP